LLDDEAVRALIADEMGMARQHLLGLSGLSPDAPVSAACVIDEIEPSRTFKSDARSGRLRRLHISDGSARLTLMLWDEEVDLVEQLGLRPGSRIRILAAVLKNTKYGPQIHVGRNGFIVLENPAETPSSPVRCDIKDLDSGTVIVRGVLLSFSVFGRGRKRSARGRLFDGTGEIEVRFVGTSIEALLGSNIGVEIEMSGAKVVSQDGQKQLVCDETANIRIL
jgi:ssDNA-binding replication factor A large subunit